MASAPGGASQRLLTMKFMQRAAAASPTSPSTPASASDDVHSSKRRKTGGRSSLGGASVPATYVVDQKAAQAALEDEDRKRQVAMDKMAERLGDSHWVLDTTKLPSSQNKTGTPLKIVQVGFSEIDRRGGSEEGQDDDQEEARAFQSYGPKEKVQKEKNNKESDSDSDDSDSGSDSDSENSKSDSSSEEVDEAPQNKPGRTSYGTQARDEIRARRKAAQEKSRLIASERREKVVKLDKLTSISGGGNFDNKQGQKGSRPGQRR